MNQQFRHRQFTASNPFANVLVVLVGIIVISISIALGFVVFVALAGFMLVMAAVVAVRVWWMKRKLRGRQGAEQPQAAHKDGPRRVIEGEFTEIRRTKDD